MRRCDHHEELKVLIRATQMRTRQRGLSLIELITALLIAAVVTGIAIPSFERVFAQNSLATTANALLGALLSARQTAITRNTPVTICAGTASEGCDGEWATGRWIVFVDADHDGLLGNDEEVRQAVQLSLTDSISISANGPFRHAVVFMPDGTAQWPSGGFAAGRLRVCASDAFVPDTTDLTLIGSGRVVTEPYDGGGGCQPL